MQESWDSNIGVAFAVLCIAALYASVGHGGATGFLAVMSFTDWQPDFITSTALVLNAISSGIAWLSYFRAGHFSLKLTLPIVAVSVPSAYIGAMFKMDERQYSTALGVVLFLVALRLLFFSKSTSDDKFETPPRLPLLLISSLLLGLISGAIGIGGGVFLSPLLVLCRWADPKTTSATAAAFTCLNSISGLISKVVSGRFLFDPFSMQGAGLIVCALLGSALGSRYGSKVARSQVLMRLIALVLFVATCKLLFTKGH
ncbi:MAG: sulfite exporter TauE/SafE family protein [Candidatus Melainabacteria bacterium]|nr:MAG: sulfite exporter TauE/SafE family protein [Candidatus Melainabacteria bacterium]